MSRRNHIVRILLIAALLAMAVPSWGAEERLDLNRASLAQIRELPVEPGLARRIWEHREFVDWFQGVQDLLKVQGVTPAKLAELKPLVTVNPVYASPEQQRKDDLFYRFEWWEGAEGTDESLVELYKDLALDPVNVNEASILDLQNLQSVSPVDAVSVVRYRDQVGRIGNRSELRRAPGFSGWGYSNLRNFVAYEEPEQTAALHGNYSLRVETTNYFSDSEDILRDDRDGGQGTNDNWWDRLGLDSPEPAVWQKLRLRYGRRYQAGVTTSRRLGEDDLLDTRKGFVGVEDIRLGDLGDLGPISLDKLYVGQYQIAWGQGVVMESGDFRSSRKHGYNFGKRYDGILGDLSRSHQYTFRGVAAEGRVGRSRSSDDASSRSFVPWQGAGTEWENPPAARLGGSPGVRAAALSVGRGLRRPAPSPPPIERHEQHQAAPQAEDEGRLRNRLHRRRAECSRTTNVDVREGEELVLNGDRKTEVVARRLEVIADEVRVGVLDAFAVLVDRVAEPEGIHDEAGEALELVDEGDRDSERATGGIERLPASVVVAVDWPRCDQLLGRDAEFLGDADIDGLIGARIGSSL